MIERTYKGSLVALGSIARCHHNMSILACQLLACLKTETCVGSRDQESAADTRNDTQNNYCDATNSVPRYSVRCGGSHVFPDKSGIESVVHDAVAADIVVLLRRAGVEGRQVRTRWTFRGSLVKVL